MSPPSMKKYTSESKITPTQDDGCFAITFERKYYHRGDIFIKRSLRPEEYRTRYRGLHIPRLGKERLMNEAASLRYVTEVTTIPVPKLYCDFEDNGAYYLIMEYVEGVSMSDLEEDEKAIVCRELERHILTLHALKSRRIGGQSGIVIPPYRVTLITEDEWSLESSKNVECVFCHNDLS